jgi:hypothetical protein
VRFTRLQEAETERAQGGLKLNLNVSPGSDGRKYLSTVKAYRDKDTKKPKPRTVLSLGYPDELEKKYDAYCAIVKSELCMSDGEIIGTYKGLWEIEEAFRITNFARLQPQCKTGQRSERSTCSLRSGHKRTEE